MQRLAVTLAVVVFFITVGLVQVSALTYETNQLTNDSGGYPNILPKVNNGKVVWLRKDFRFNGWNAPEGMDVFLYDGANVTTITSNPYSTGNPIEPISYVAREPQTNGEQVVWNGWGDISSQEIFIYNIADGVRKKIGDASGGGSGPQISETHVVWTGSDGSGQEIYLHDIELGTTTKITNEDYASAMYPQISDNKITWYALTDWGDDSEIYFFDGSTVTTVTDNSYSDANPQIDGSNIVWQGNTSNGSEIFLFDGSTVTTVTDNSYGDVNPQIDGSNIVWQGNTSNGGEIFVFDGSTVTTVSSSSSYNENPQIDGSNIVWRGHDGADYEIFLFDGAGVSALTATDYSEEQPQISGNQVVWQSPLVTQDIFLANLGVTSAGLTEDTVTVELRTDLTVSFSDVTVDGVTTVTENATDSVPPAGFAFLGDQYEISTTAGYEGTITVSINYDATGMTLEQEEALQMLRYDGVDWYNVTVSVDTDNNIITGQASSFSLWAVGSFIGLPASIDIDPGTLNMKSKGAYISAYLRLPGDYSVADIDLSKPILLHGPDEDVTAETFPIELGDDSDGDGKPDYLMVKFDRNDVQEKIVPGPVEGPVDVDLGVTFTLLDGTSCGGSDTIKVIDKGKAHFDSRDPASVEY